MKMHNFLPLLGATFAFCLFTFSLFSQSNIQQTLSVNSTGTAAHASAQLDVSSTDKGMLVPRMTSAQRSAIASPATGLLVFDTDTGGFWFYNGTSWTNLSAPKTLADADNDTKIQVEESPDEDNIRFDVAGSEAMVITNNGRVGIGTTAPGHPLQVHADGYGIVHTFGGVGLSTFLDNSGAWLGTTTNHPLYFYTNDSPVPHMMIDNVGKVGIGTSSPNASALLDVSATDKGMLVPRMTTAQRTAIASPATGLLVYDTDTNAFWFYNGTTWTTIGGGVSTLIADTDNDTKIQVEESPDEDIIRFDLAGSENMVLRKNASGHTRLEFSNTSENTYIGHTAGTNSSLAMYNTAIGKGAMADITVAISNTAIGRHALYKNLVGDQNTATGSEALYSSTTGRDNTATGHAALFYNTDGNFNTATGFEALVFNTTGSSNTSSGRQALISNTTGHLNTGIGAFTNVSVGNLLNASAFGANATVNASNKVRIGDAAVTVIEGQVDWTFPSDARFKFNIHDDAVPGLAFIEKLRPVTYQFDTRKFDEHLMQLMPDSIQQRRMAGQDYSKSSATVQTGFLAQEVEQVCKDMNFEFSGLHVPTSEVDNYGLAYGSFVPLLVKAVQEQQEEIDEIRKLEIEKLKAENAALKSEIHASKAKDEQQKAQLEVLKSQLDKIAAALAGAGITVEK